MSRGQEPDPLELLVQLEPEVRELAALTLRYVRYSAQREPADTVVRALGNNALRKLEIVAYASPLYRVQAAANAELRREVEKLRAALQQITDFYDGRYIQSDADEFAEAHRVLRQARAALTLTEAQP